MEAHEDYISVGGNCHPSAADWSHDLELLAYGAGNNVALWHPHNTTLKGAHSLLYAHSNAVQAVKFVSAQDARPFLVTGGADTALALWVLVASSSPGSYRYELAVICKDGHSASVNCIAASPICPNKFVTGSADGNVKIWNIKHEPGHLGIDCSQSLALQPSLLPLALSLTKLNDGTLLLAVGGTKPTIQLWAASRSSPFIQQAVLSGHDGWIRSLDFVRDTTLTGGDTLLASASQDKYIRLWRVHSGSQLQIPGSSDSQQILEPALSNKIHKIAIEGSVHIVTFEALLVGHEDWIYSARWFTSARGLQLLSTSADNTVAIWQADEFEGVWYALHKFGEISAQKGSTTATGSMGGLWNGLWGPCGDSFIALARTGGWLKWQLLSERTLWQQTFGVGGHVKSVKDLAWSRDGGYLLTVSADQTTRLHSQWQRPQGGESWHEFSRPQIHGYDLNCISALGSFSFISGADEKLIRVFEEPDDVAALLENLCTVEAPEHRNLFAADIPVLGLSNKAIEGENQLRREKDINDQEHDRSITPEAESSEDKARSNVMAHPPLEDYLSKRSLWPEKEKLYGHGFEINAVATSRDGSIIASSCKASSIDHAVIRLFDTKSWQQVSPPLRAHTLTVTCLEFNEDDNFMLSVGRDRQWVVWKRDESAVGRYVAHASNSKAHSRMILCASWLRSSEACVFATGGRDKCVKFWKSEGDGFKSFDSVTTSAPVVAIATLSDPTKQQSIFAIGLESGDIRIFSFGYASFAIVELSVMPASTSNRLPISQLSWRPRRFDSAGRTRIGPDDWLAIASEDHSIRVYKISGL